MCIMNYTVTKCLYVSILNYTVHSKGFVYILNYTVTKGLFLYILYYTITKSLFVYILNYTVTVFYFNDDMASIWLNLSNNNSFLLAAKDLLYAPYHRQNRVSFMITMSHCCCLGFFVGGLFVCIGDVIVIFLCSWEIQTVFVYGINGDNR